MNFLLGRWLLLALLVALPVAGAIYPVQAAEKSSEPGKRIDYEKLKLPELLKRANGKDIKAQFELGSRFNYGHGVPKNVPEALQWLRRAGQGGSGDAQRVLALKFFNGYDVAVDYDEALRWAQLLAQSGDFSGQMMLASMYANGEGGPRNLIQSYAWYDIAASTAQQSEDEISMQNAEQAADAREKTAALLMQGELAEAQKIASDWWLKRQGVSLDAPPKAAKKRRPAKKRSAAKPASPQPKPAQP